MSFHFTQTARSPRTIRAIALSVSLVALGCAEEERIIRPATGDSIIVAVITPAGAVVEFPGVAQLRFSSGSFTSPETVTVWLSGLPATDKGLEYYRLGRGGSPPYLPRDMAVRGTTQPRLELEVMFMSAASLDCTHANAIPHIFRAFIGGGSMEALGMYQALPSIVDAKGQAIHAPVIAPPIEQDTLLDEVFHVGCFTP